MTDTNTLAPPLDPYRAPQSATRDAFEPLEGDRSAHPWRRYFAKFIDLTVLSFSVMFVGVIALVLLLPNQAAAMMKPLDNQLVAGIVMLLFWIPLEAVLVSFANTPGRWIYGLRVRTMHGERLAFGQSLLRAGLLSVQGLGLSIPIFALVAQIVAYRRLKSSGSTLWDDQVGTEVVHAEMGTGRMVVAALATVGLVVGVVFLTALG